MSTVLFRKSSGEVLKVSLSNQNFLVHPNVAVRYGMLTDPATPDGTAIVDATGARRVLGVAKLALVGTNTIRNATQGELNGWAAAETDDSNADDAVAAGELFDVDAVMRKVIKALVQGVVQEDERLRAQWEAFKADIAATTSLADLKTRLAAYPTLPARTKAGVLAALKALIQSTD